MDFWFSNSLKAILYLPSIFSALSSSLLSLAPPLFYFPHFAYHHLPLHSIFQSLLQSSFPSSPGTSRFTCLQHFLLQPKNPFTFWQLHWGGVIVLSEIPLDLFYWKAWRVLLKTISKFASFNITSQV